MKLANVADSIYGGHVMYTPESIDYQHGDSFPSELEAIFTEYKDLVDSGASQKVITADTELKNKLEKLIRDRLGIKVILVTDSYLAATIPNLYTVNSAVVRDAIRDEYKLLNVDITGAKALSSQVSGSKLVTVNAREARVSGWMADQPVPMFLNFHDLFKTTQLTVPESVAVGLHELGHVINAIQYAYAVNQANLIMKDIAESVNSGRRGDVTYIYKELSKLDKDLSEDTVRGLLSDSPVVYGVSAFRTVMGITTSLSGSKVHDRSSSESQADSFVARFGMGEPLVTGLQKLHNDPLYRTAEGLNSVTNVCTFAGLLFIIAGLLLNVIGGSLTVTGRIILTVLSMTGILTLKEINSYSTQDREYDDNISRYKRILRNMIGALKDPSLPKEVKKTILMQIETVEGIINRSSNVPNILQKLLLLAFPADRRAQRSLLSQQKVEEVLSNQIFKMAAKLDVKE